MLNDYLKSINKTKEDVMVDEEAEKQYQSYITNRCLSGFIDTLFQANDMNMYSFLDKRMQYDYLRHSIRAQNRFTPWLKQEKNEEIALVMEYYSYNRLRAEEALALMSKSDIEYISMYLNRGGFEKVKTPKTTKKGKKMKEI
jgi:hypothetical protein